MMGFAPLALRSTHPTQTDRKVPAGTPALPGSDRPAFSSPWFSRDKLLQCI